MPVPITSVIEELRRTLTAISYEQQEQLADYLCIERSAMSTELSRLQKEGLLQTERYHFRLIAPLPGTLGR